MVKFTAGIVTDSLNLEAWKHNVVSWLMTSEDVSISCILFYHPTEKDNVYGCRRKDPLIIRTLENLTTQPDIYNKSYDDLIDSSDLLKDVPVLNLNPGSIEHAGSYLDAGSINLDAIIDLIGAELPDRLKVSPTYGVWRIRPDQRLVNNGILSDFWDLARRSPAIKMSLEIEGYSSKGTIDVCTTFESVLPFSQHINRNKAYWRAALLIPRVIDGVVNNGKDFLDDLIERTSVNNIVSDVERARPGVLGKLQNFIVFLCVLSRQIVKKLFYGIEEEWQIMIDMHNDDLPSFEFGRFKKLNPPEGFFWADPFVVYHEDNYYMFVEEISFSEPNAHISVLRLNKKGDVISGSRILERPYHMSYPFVFTYDNEYYMIPETSGNKTIDIYKCLQFPDKWEFHKTIMNGLSAVDTTLFEYKGKWWLFTSIDESKGSAGLDTDLFLFFSDNPLTGTWNSHPLNPVVSDVRSARPAGKIYIKDGNIFRPSQNCSGRYGRAINLNMIKVLSETDYQEEVFMSIEPDWDNKLKGTHTLNFDGLLTVIDAYKFRKRKIRK